MRLRKLLQLAVVSSSLVVTGAALAEKDAREVALKDGTTLVIFKDGKMTMRDARGRVHGMKDGVPMETKDGKVFMMKGNEIWRKTPTERFLEGLYRGG